MNQQRPAAAAYVHLLQAGIAQHQAGRLAEAEAAYRQVLAVAPRQPDALHLLGLIAYASHRHDPALDLIGQAIAANGNNAAYFNSRGIVLRDLRRLEAALADFDRALALQPTLFDAHLARAAILLELQHSAAALESFDRAIKLRPDAAAAHAGRGVALAGLGRPADALASYDRAIALDPANPGTFSNRGAALRDLGQPAAAVASCDRAIALAAGFAGAHRNRGVALTDLGRCAEAVESLDRAIALQPADAEAHRSRGLALHALLRLEEAADSFDRAVALRPDHAETCFDRGNALHALGRLEEAVENFDRAIALRPGYAEAHSNRGAALQAMLRLDEAAAAFDHAIALRPDYPEGHSNKGFFLLQSGRLAEGFRLLESLWRSEKYISHRRGFTQPEWHGEKLNGRSLLLHEEEGLGDVIQFCRYAPMAAALGSVILEAPASLLPLLADLPGIARVLPRGAPLPAFDLRRTLLHLPLVFGTDLATIPAPVGYLRADPARRALWAPRLAQTPTPRVGIAWSGNPAHNNDRNRSMPLATMRPLFGSGAALHVLQTFVRESDRAELARNPEVINLGVGFADFADTAAAIAELDLVIAVDTSVAHLAAALGKPTWLLLPFAPDWRWMLGREDSPWYPTMRLFRQTARGDWESVIARVRAALADFAPARRF